MLRGALFLVMGCWLALGVASADGSPLRAVATTGMVGDLARRVGGPQVEVTVLMGPGVDPHLYKPTPADARALASADVIFHSGLRLEGRMEELFGKLRAQGRRVASLGAELAPEDLLHPKEFKDQPDPHIWLDASLWAKTIPAVVRGLSEADPANAETYRRNGEAARADLEALHAWSQEAAAKIPEAARILVTSHDAFNYFGRAYGFQVVGLQGVSTVSEAGLSDMANLADFLRRNQVRAIFVETSVNPAALRRVSEDSGTRIGGELFSDAMGAPGEMRHGFDAGTYEGMLKANMTTIVEALQ